MHFLRQRLLAPEMVEEFVAAYHEEVNRHRRDETAARTAGRAAQERELAEVRRKLDGLIDAIAEGMRAPGLQQRLDELEARRAALEQALSEEAPPPVRMHPNLAQAYRERSSGCRRRLRSQRTATKPSRCCAG
jgi:site-specific DNA recombinase